MKYPSIFFALLILVLSCNKDEEPTTRTYRMGFQNFAPRFDDFDLVLATLDLWTKRADAAIISTEVPWKELLEGMSVDTYVVDNYKGLVEYYRDKNLELWVYIDPQNGLDRTSDALALQDAGKSIADADMQLLYRKFVVAMDSILNPEHLGLALETNLIRSASAPAIYNGVKDAANAAARDILKRKSDVKISVSVQVDHAWGKLGGGVYSGINQDFIDFSFVQELGISSYPYFGFDHPGDIPINYYSRLIEGKSIDVFISEGGWTSQSLNALGKIISSSPQIQEEYIRHHAHILDQVQAIALFQLAFTDIDLANLSMDVPENLVYFSYLGLVDIHLDPKPSLSAWDDLFHNRSLKEK